VSGTSFTELLDDSLILQHFDVVTGARSSISLRPINHGQGLLVNASSPHSAARSPARSGAGDARRDRVPDPPRFLIPAKINMMWSRANLQLRPRWLHREPIAKPGPKQKRLHPSGAASLFQKVSFTCRTMQSVGIERSNLLVGAAQILVRIHGTLWTRTHSEGAASGAPDWPT